jgi:citrate synthase
MRTSGPQLASDAGVMSPELALEVRDPWRHETHFFAIEDVAVHATDLATIKAPDGGGLVSFDPAFMNTAACVSSITFVDGDAGILRYRGYPIEQLAERRSFLDVAYLLIYGELPDEAQAAEWTAAVAANATVPDEIVRLVATFPVDAHPMSILLSAWAALGAYRLKANAVDDAAARALEIPRMLGSAGAVASLVLRHRRGETNPTRSNAPDYAARLLADMVETDALRADQRLIDAVNVLLVLHADHEQNCSTHAVRAVGSSRVDPYSAIASGIAALFGPLHGGANEAVIRMLHEIGDVANVPAFIAGTKRGERRLMGFGHRVYKSYDPRARLIKTTCEQVFAVTGRNPLLDVAVAVERTALEDPYFIDRKLYPNVDFYSGLIYEALGLPTDTYTVLFAAARMAGWIAQWREMIEDSTTKIVRPRQIYRGPLQREVPSE